MANRAFLRPNTMNMPVQGDFEFKPLIIFYEDTTMAGLQAQVVAGAAIQQQNPTDLFVVEEIEYQVSVLQPIIGMNPAVLNYSCMIHISWAHRI
jgi:hypothetical protein